MNVSPETKSPPVVTAAHPKPTREPMRSLFADGKLPDVIPIATLVFNKMQKVLHNHNAESLDATVIDERRNSDRWIINYSVRAQIYEIQFHPADQRHPITRCIIHTENVQYARPL